MKHSPTPWRVVRYEDSLQVDVYAADGRSVATMGHFADDPAADAAYIVEAVNLKARIDEAMTDESSFKHISRMENGKDKPVVFVQPPPSEAEEVRIYRELYEGAFKDRLMFERSRNAAVNERDRLRDLVRQLADIVRHECNDYCIALTREAYAAIGEEVPE